MKLLLENWRKFVTESNKKMGTIDGEVDLWTANLYNRNGEWITIGKEGEKLEVEIISGWQDQGAKEILIRVVDLEYDDGDPVEGWVDAAAVGMNFEEAVDKDSMPCNEPRTTQTHKGKSHVVKACADGKEKVIPFGEKGASTAGAPKKGESEKMKKKRKSFKSRHAKNIKKGRMSAAYWADKVKW